MSTPSTSQTIRYTHCPVCKSEKIAEVLTATDHTVSHELFDIWHCEICELRFTQDIPVESEIGRYYQAEEYISHSNTKKGIINSLYQVIRDYTLKQKRKLIRKLSGQKSGSILDIGCGTGEFLHTMKKAGWETMGLEPDEGARTQAQQNWNLEVHESEHLFSLKSNSYDVITMWHVLEHVHRLHEYLNIIYQLMKPDATLIIAVPNYRSLDAEKYRSHWAAYDVPRHLYHFSASALNRLVSQHGFEVVKMKTMPFDAFYVSLLSEKYIHGKNRLISAFIAGFRSFLKAWSQVDRSSSIL